MARSTSTRASTLTAGITSGLLAGAAGATALNAMSYVHQAVYATPTNDLPERTAAAALGAVAGDATGAAVERSRRVEALGPLAGLGVGMGVGAAAGALRALTVKVPFAAAAAALGVTALAISHGVSVALGTTRPSAWTLNDVGQDGLPHLAYGAVTVLALHRMLDPHTVQVR